MIRCGRHSLPDTGYLTHARGSRKIDRRRLSSPPKLHQNPDETPHIRRLQNGLERRDGRSRPAPRYLASLVGTDAFAGALTRGSIGTIPETAETENTRSYQEVLWLMSQSVANQS